MRPDVTGNRGFVLPTTLLVMTLLTIMLTAAFTMVSAEYRQTDNSFGRAKAHALAQAALQTYYSQNRPLTGTSDSLRIVLTGGYVDVVARRLRDSTPTQLAVWLVRASATATDPVLSGLVSGKRTIVQLAHYNPPNFPARSALIAANGVHIKGLLNGAAPINGLDNSCSSPGPNMPGLVTRTGQYTEDCPGCPSDPTGNPGINYLGTSTQVIANSRIDWVSLVAGNFTPDYQLPGPVVWNDSSVIYVPGNYTLGPGLPNPALGVLIVTGNLIMNSNAHWHGVILVGGYVSVVAGGRVHGMVVSGLNIALGATVPKDTIIRGGTPVSEFFWRSCEFAPAVQSLSALVPLGNAWVDTWSTY